MTTLGRLLGWIALVSTLLASGPAEAVTYQEAVLNHSPEVYLQLNETAGSATAANSGSDSAISGAATNGPTFGVTAPYSSLGTAVDLGTNNAYFVTGTAQGTFPLPPAPSGTGDLGQYLGGTASLEFWINTTQAGSDGWNGPALTGADNSQTTNGNHGGAHDIWWGAVNNGRIGIRIGNGSTMTSSTAINDGQWHHVLMTRDAPSNEIQIYLDGNPGPDGSHGGGTTVFQNAWNWLGNGGSAAVNDIQHLDAQIDEVAIYHNQVLTGTDAYFHHLAAAGQAADSGYSAAVQADAPVVWYRFEEPATATGIANHGSAAADYTATMQNTVALGQPSMTVHLGSAADLGTAQGHFVAENYLSNYLNGTASLEFWINTTQTPLSSDWRSPALMGEDNSTAPGGGSGADSWWGVMQGLGVIGINTSLVNGDLLDVATPSAINDGQWHHLVMTRDATTGAAEIYLDGGLVATATIAGTIGYTYNAIGRGSAGQSNAFLQAKIDEMAIYDYVLDAGRVLAHFQAAMVPEPSTFMLSALGLLSLGIVGWRRRNRA